MDFFHFLHCKVILYKGDVRKLRRQRHLDYIIHCAAMPSPIRFVERPVDVNETNIIGTANLLKIAQQTHAIILFVSSVAIYGHYDGILTETKYGYHDPQEKSACYSVSKLCAENLCLCYWKQYQTQVRIVRPAYIYGPRFPQLDHRGFADFISAIRDRVDMELHSDGTDTRDFIYVADAIKCCLLVILNGENGGIYNCGTGTETSILDLVTLLTMNTNSNIVYKLGAGYQPLPNHHECFDITKELEIGFTPHFNVREGIERTKLFLCR